MNINRKQRDFFQELSKYPNRNRSYEELASLLNVSTRSIRNYCTIIEECGAAIGILQIIERSPTGLLYTASAEQTRQIWAYISSFGFYEYHLSPDDRILSIALILLTAQSPVTVMELCDILFVSRATILNDIEKVRLYFQQYHVNFHESTNRGYSLNIDEARRQEIICTTCFPHLKDWNPLGDEHGTFYFLSESILHLSPILPEICKIVQDAEKQYQINIADIFFRQVVFTLAILCKRIHMGCRIDTAPFPEPQWKTTSVGKIALTMLTQAQDLLQLTYTEQDLFYLAWRLHICHFDLLQNFEHSVDLYFYMEVHQFLQEIDKELHCGFSEDLNLAIMLTRHIWSIRSGNFGKNPIDVSELIQNYPDCCRVVRKHIHIIEQSMGKPCSEAAFYSILLYIVAKVEKNSRESEKPRVIVLCHVGIGTANYLAEQLRETFNLEIAGVTAIHRLSEVLSSNSFDFLISTVPLKLNGIPSVTVSPNLEDEDILAVQKALTSIRRQKRAASREKSAQKRRLLHTSPLFNTEHIVLDVPCKSWKEALHIAAQPLLNHKEILPSYVEAITKSVDINGPYFVFCPGVALAHAAPSDGVLEFCLSIYRPEHPVSFHHAANDPVSLILMIGITDVRTQVSTVSALMETLRQKHLLEKLLNVQTAEELISILFDNH